MDQQERVIAQAQVVVMRAELYRDGIVDHAEAALLIQLDREATTTCVEWDDFLAEEISDFLVFAKTPEGYVGEEDADWLTAQIARDGILATPRCLELLIRTLEKARQVPVRLSEFVLRQVADTVMQGNTKSGRAGRIAGVVDRADVELIRRILFATGSDANVAITQAEADILFEINDRTVEEMNDPAWTDLYVKAIANFVLATSGAAVPAREEALRRDRFLESADPDLAGFFRRMISGSVGGIFDAFRETGTERAWAARNRQRNDGEARSSDVAGDEARWLVDRIGRDRLLHDNERALLAFLKREAHAIHPELRSLVEKVA